MPTDHPLAPAGSREVAQARVDRIAAFRAELETVERDGALSLDAGTRERLREYHDRLLEGLARQFDVDRGDAERRMSLGMRLASLVGAMALSAAVFFFFYRFWGALAVWAQVAILTVGPIALLAGVEVAARRERTLYIASLLALVAAASFGLNLGVLGAEFNLVATPLAIGAWGLFVLFMAYGHGLRLLLAGALAALVACATAWPANLAGIDWTSAILRPEPAILSGAALMALADTGVNRSRAGFPATFRVVGLLAVFLPLLIVSGWGEFSYLPWPPDSVEAIYDGLGFALPAAGLWIGLRRRWPEVVNLSAAFLVLFIYVKCFEWAWDWLPRYLFFLMLAAIAIALLFLLRRLRAQMRQV